MGRLEAGLSNLPAQTCILLSRPVSIVTAEIHSICSGSEEVLYQHPQRQASVYSSAMATPTDNKDDMKKDINMVERYEVASDDMEDLKKSKTMGTITINDSNEILLIPSPSADPRGMNIKTCSRCS